MRLKLEHGEWKKLQPNRARSKFGLGKTTRKIVFPNFKGKPFRRHQSLHPSLTSYQSCNRQYGKADEIFKNKIINGVGLRFKGNGATLAAITSPSS